MSLNAHLSQLRQKHEALSQQIEDEERRPAADALQIAAMKRQKLMIKDEIRRLDSEYH